MLNTQDKEIWIFFFSATWIEKSSPYGLDVLPLFSFWKKKRKFFHITWTYCFLCLLPKPLVQNTNIHLFFCGSYRNMKATNQKMIWRLATTAFTPEMNILKGKMGNFHGSMLVWGWVWGLALASALELESVLDCWFAPIKPPPEILKGDSSDPVLKSYCLNQYQSHPLELFVIASHP